MYKRQLLGFRDYRLRYRVRGVGLRSRADTEQLVFRHTLGSYSGDCKAALCKGAGLVKHERARSRQFLEIVRALYHDTILRSPADTAEIGERNRNNQSAGAGNYQKRQRTVNPAAFADPVGEIGEAVHRSFYKTRNYRQRDSREHHDRSIHLREFRNEVLGLCLVLGGVLDQFQDTRNGGVGVGARYLDFEQAVRVDAAAYYLVALCDRTECALSGERRSVQLGGA